MLHNYENRFSKQNNVALMKKKDQLQQNNQ